MAFHSHVECTLHDRIISLTEDALAYRTSLTLLGSLICLYQVRKALGISIMLLSMKCLIDLWTVPTMWYFCFWFYCYWWISEFVIGMRDTKTMYFFWSVIECVSGMMYHITVIFVIWKLDVCYVYINHPNFYKGAWNTQYLLRLLLFPEHNTSSW